MDMMTENRVIQQYVAGFLFDRYRSHVLLITKLKPNWQAGYYNGVGGKIEHGETPYEAMVREFKEEAGLTVSSGWRQCAKLRWPTATVYFFSAVYPYELSDAKSMTDEELIIVPVQKVPQLRVIPNLKWLIPLAADEDNYLADAQTEKYGI